MSNTSIDIYNESLLPQNIKDNNTLSTLLKIYFNNDKEVQNIINSPLDLYSADFLIDKFLDNNSNSKYDDVRKELFKIHLEEIYSTFKDIDQNEDIFNVFKEIYELLHIPIDNLKIVAGIDKQINSQYINTSRSFKTKKGTKAGYFFVYDIINKANIQSLNNDHFFELLEGTVDNKNEPFSYRIRTSLYKEVIENTLIPLAHPVGFYYDFLRLILLKLEDYFGLEVIKAIEDIKIICFKNSDTDNTSVNYDVLDGRYGKFYDFEISTDEKLRTKVILDFLPIKHFDYESYGIEPLFRLERGLRLVKDYDGRIVLYNRQSNYIENLVHKSIQVQDVRLRSVTQGILDVYKYRAVDVNEVYLVQDIKFQEYTIFDKDSFEVEFTIFGDLPDKWYVSKIPLTNKSTSTNIKLFEHKIFDSTDILKNCVSNYDGVLVKDFGYNCVLEYTSTYKYRPTTSDISEYVNSVRGERNMFLPTTVADPLYSPKTKDSPGSGYSSTDHTIEETDTRTQSDYWARLNPNYDVPYIGDPVPGLVRDIGSFDLTVLEGVPIFDRGFNQTKDNDNNILLPTEQGFKNGRKEMYYSPSIDADLKLLAGEYIKDYEVKYNNSVIGTQKIKYINSVKNSAVNDIRYLKGLIPGFDSKRDPREVYLEQNIGNDDYTAKEYYTESLEYNMFIKETMLEPVYDLPYLNYIGFKEYELESENGLFVGGYSNRNCIKQGNPSYHVKINEELVDADPVNLQYMTYDCRRSTDLKTLEDNTGLYIHNSKDLVFSKEVYEHKHDYENYTYYDELEKYWFIENGYCIGTYPDNLNVNEFNIYGTEVKSIESLYRIDYKDMNTITEYSYNTFKSAKNLDNFDVDNNTDIGGIVFKEQVNAEVYRSTWHKTYDDNDLDNMYLTICNVTISTDKHFLDTELTEYQSYVEEYKDEELYGIYLNDFKLGQDRDLTYIGGIPFYSVKGQSTYGVSDLTENSEYEEHTKEFNTDIFKENYLNSESTNDSIYDYIIPELVGLYKGFYNKTEEDVFAKEDTRSTLDYSVLDYYESIETKNRVDLFDVDNNSYVGYIPLPIKDDINLSVIEFTVFSKNLYSYNTFANIKNLDEFDVDNDSNVGGESYTKEVDADIYRSIWNNSIDDDTLDYSTISEKTRISETISDDTDNLDIDNKYKFCKESSINSTDYKNFYTENYNFIESDNSLNTFTIEDSENSILLRGIEVPITETYDSTLSFNLCHLNTYEYCNYSNPNNDEYINSENRNVDNNSYVGGFNYSKEVLAEIFNEDLLNSDTEYYTCEPVLIDNTPTITGEEYTVSVDYSKITDEVPETEETALTNCIINEDSVQTHTEYNTEVPVLVVVDDGDIGDYYISGKAVQISTLGDSYFKQGEFDYFSDVDDFSFGVYRDGELLEDNNVSKAE